MSKDSAALKDMDLVTLIGGIAHDTGTLVNQQIELLRADLSQEAQRAGGAMISLAAGGGLLAAGGLLSGMMLAHGLNQATRLPLWLCYGIVGGGISATGVKLLQTGRDKIANVELLPPAETAAALQENVAWAKTQIGLESE